MQTGSHCVYVIQNPAGRYYIGLTDDLQRRLRDHNGGTSKWTRGKGPWNRVWQQGPLTLSEARKLESELKRQKGGDGFFRLTGLVRS